MALFVGIAVGFSFVRSEVVSQMDRRLADLQHQYSDEVVPLRDQERRLSDFVNGVAPLLVRNELSGVRVALIQTGDYPETIQRIRSTLEQGGVVVSSVTVVDAAFPTKGAAALSKLMATLQVQHPGLAVERDSLLRVLANAIARGGPEAELAALEDAGVIQRERDSDYTVHVSNVVLVGGAGEEFESRADTVDLPLINDFKTLGATVVEAEPSDAAISYISTLRPADIATVDDADLDIGRVSVALALRAAPGDYGIKRTARNGIVPTAR